MGQLVQYREAQFAFPGHGSTSPISGSTSPISPTYNDVATSRTDAVTYTAMSTTFASNNSAASPINPTSVETTSAESTPPGVDGRKETHDDAAGDQENAEPSGVVFVLDFKFL